MRGEVKNEIAVLSTVVRAVGLDRFGQMERRLTRLDSSSADSLRSE